MTPTAEERRTIIAWARGCLVGFVLLTLLAAFASGPLTDVDHALGTPPFELTAHVGWLRDLAVWIEAVTQPDHVVAVALLVAIGLYLDGRPRAAEFAIIVPALARFAYPAIKELIDRPRPVWDDPIRTLPSWSFPSGHTTVIAAASGAAIVLAICLIEAGPVRRAAIAAAVLLTVVVGLDRLLLGVHHPTDVLAGILLGAGITLSTALVLDPTHDREPVTSDTQSF